MVGMARPTMDEDQRELVRRLFVRATEVAEAVHQVAISGQELKEQAADYAAAAEALVRHGDALKALGNAIQIAIAADE